MFAAGIKSPDALCIPSSKVFHLILSAVVHSRAARPPEGSELQPSPSVGGYSGTPLTYLAGHTCALPGNWIFVSNIFGCIHLPHNLVNSYIMLEGLLRTTLSAAWTSHKSCSSKSKVLLGGTEGSWWNQWTADPRLLAHWKPCCSISSGTLQQEGGKLLFYLQIEQYGITTLYFTKLFFSPN